MGLLPFCREMGISYISYNLIGSNMALHLFTRRSIKMGLEPFCREMRRNFVSLKHNLHNIAHAGDTVLQS